MQLNFLLNDWTKLGVFTANLYSLIETAKANTLEPYEYLKMVFTQLPKANCSKDIETLLPFSPAHQKDEAA